MLKKLLKITGLVLVSLALLLVFLILALRWINPPFTSFTLQEQWAELEKDRYNLRVYWVPADELPEHVIWAVIASEDQLFFEHLGFDIESIQEAWEEHQEGERTRGASTISQQVAKNLFLWPAQSFFRKGVESVITVIIELFWSKSRIVEMYLNIAEFGPGIYGVGKASDVYFQRPAGQITPEMAARLAAVLPSPKRMRVNPPSPYAQQRSRWILRQMNQLTGKIFYRFEEEPVTSTPAVTEADSASPDSLSRLSVPDSLTYDLVPDTLLRNLPDTAASVTDTTNSLGID